MFTEFIIIYVLLGVMAALQAAILILQIISMRQAANSLPPEMFFMANTPVQPQSPVSYGQPPLQDVAAAADQPVFTISDERNVVICRSCHTQYDGSAASCPKCGTVRP